MIRRLIIGTVLASVTAAAAAGCGGGGDKAKPEVAWAGKVCDGVSASGAGLTFPQLDTKDRAGSAKALAEFLSAMETHLKTMETKLQSAGAPPIDNGQTALNTALANLRGTETAVRAASSKLTKAKVTDAKSFKAAIAQAGQAMQKVQTYQGPTKDLRANPSLAKAFDQAGSCKTHQL